MTNKDINRMWGQEFTEEALLRSRTALEQWHLSYEAGYRFDQALIDKWFMVTIAQGGKL